MEDRDVATVDIPGAFMYADMDQLVHMKLEGKMAELLVKIDPKLYQQHIIMEGNKPVIYVELQKALYGTLRAALLFWRMLTKQLEEWGFEVNPYDCCMANKIIEGSQCTVIWHVDDLKISHVDAGVITDIIKQLNLVYGKEAPLTVNKGKVHEYLGMTLDFSNQGKVVVSMKDYVINMLKELPQDMEGIAATPAAEHLFDVDISKKLPLNEDQSIKFHHYVAKLLFLCKQAHPDIQTAVAFLSTRVKEPDMHDYKKLARVMWYLQGTIDLSLVLEADNVTTIKWWVDGAFGVHPDLRSHTGGTMSLGKGSVYSTSIQQKLNTKSSTEAELVAVNDTMGQVLWTQYFLEAQGYPPNISTIFQDNKSAISLEKNGRGSSSKRIRHINIRYCFITDRIASGDIKVEHCHTTDMVGNFFTKPLQGAQFRKFHNIILNNNDIDPEIDESQDHRSVLGNNNDTTRLGDISTHKKRPMG
jgi:Reverse transcriptase (RNA-dependent DNA polymerase)